jgi:hypothetical protein
VGCARGRGLGGFGAAGENEAMPPMTERKPRTKKKAAHERRSNLSIRSGRCCQDLPPGTPRTRDIFSDCHVRSPIHALVTHESSDSSRIHDCGVPRHELDAYLDSALAADSSAAMREHLLRCVACQAAARQQIQYRRRMRQQARSEGASATLVRRVLGLMAGEMEQPRRR